MDLKTLNAYALYGAYKPCDEVEIFSEGIQYPNAIYSLETSVHGVVADNTDDTWNGFARPSFVKEQLEPLVNMINQVDEVEANVQGENIAIYNGASGEHEIVIEQNGRYELAGWSLYKFDKQDIYNRILYDNWTVDDIANLILWLEANDAKNYDAFHEREFSLESDELRRLAYLAVMSIMRLFNVRTVHGLIEQHEELKPLIDEYKN